MGKVDKWIVSSVTGNRAVLGKNAGGMQNINSPVNTVFLVTAEMPKQVTKKTEVSVAGQMKISERCVSLVAKYEGCGEFHTHYFGPKLQRNNFISNFNNQTLIRKR